MLLFKQETTTNMELNDLRKIICLRKTEVFTGRICNVIEVSMEHGNCLPCSNTNDIIKNCYHSNLEFILMSK